MKKLCLITILLSLFVTSCQKKEQSNKFKVVTTTTMISDLAKNIGGDSVQVIGLMGAGVDPHLYKASEGDVQKITSSDILFYSGLHLEGKMVDIFENMEKKGKKAYALSDGIPEDRYISSKLFVSNYDPHIWFSVENWIDATKYMTEQLSLAKPDSKEYFQKNEAVYIDKLNHLKDSLTSIANKLPENKRILVTAHDAFNYFGKEYNFKVMGLQGISTASEAGTKDLLDLANFIVENKIPAIFVESSIPKQTILALQEAVKSKGYNVKVGGTLYSDALGSPDSPEGNYIEMYLYNMNTIVNALKNE